MLHLIAFRSEKRRIVGGRSVRHADRHSTSVSTRDAPPNKSEYEQPRTRTQAARAGPPHYAGRQEIVERWQGRRLLVMWWVQVAACVVAAVVSQPLQLFRFRSLAWERLDHADVRKPRVWCFIEAWTWGVFVHGVGVASATALPQALLLVRIWFPWALAAAAPSAAHVLAFGAVRGLTNVPLECYLVSLQVANAPRVWPVRGAAALLVMLFETVWWAVYHWTWLLVCSVSEPPPLNDGGPALLVIVAQYLPRALAAVAVATVATNALDAASVRARVSLEAHSRMGLLQALQVERDQWANEALWVGLGARLLYHGVHFCVAVVYTNFLLEMLRPG